jgi:hypothetical protein
MRSFFASTEDACEAAFESLMYEAGKIYEERTGDWLPTLKSGPREPANYRPPARADDDLQRSFPRLFARFRAAG